jgi:predicted ATPase
MGLHSGAAKFRGGDYPGPVVNKAARVISVAHGGQVLVSLATAELVRDGLGDDAGLVDLGEQRLRGLIRAERLFQVSAPRLREAFPALRSLDGLRGNLPLQVSSFVGRERDIARVADTLGEARVVTLTGVGGVGKTRLALQVAAAVLGVFRDGAWVVELAPVRDPAGVVDAFAAVFGVTARAGQTTKDAVLEFLGTKHLLLVVDNCEHLLDAVADVVEGIARSCVGVVVLATTREALVLSGEHILVVPALAAPDVQADIRAIRAADAVQLFVQRAHAVDAEFALTPDNASAVADVCRRLDGVPLAIELAAARVDIMSPAELASALDHRFDVLVDGHRSAADRQHGLRATIDWSYDMLAESQQRLLARLAVFVGGCTREAVESVCVGQPIESGAMFALLADLIRRSLVVTDRGGLDTRYRLLETIREYSAERLAEHAETDTLRDRHARYYGAYALRCSEGTWGPAQIEWGTRMTADSDNILAAFTHAIDTHDFDLVTMLMETTIGSEAQIGDSVRFPVEPVLAMAGVAQHAGYPLVLICAAWQANARGEARRALELGDAALNAERALTVPAAYTIDLTAERASLMAGIALASGAWDDAAAAYRKAAELHRSAHRARASTSLGYAAMALAFAGRFADAVPVATNGLELARASGTPFAITTNLAALAQALSHQDPARARTLLDEAIRTGLDHDNGSSFGTMAVTAATIRDWPLTAFLAARSIPYYAWINHRPYLGALLNGAARALADSDPEAAATIQGAAYALVGTPATAASPETITAAAGAPNRRGTIVEIGTTRRIAHSLGNERLLALRSLGAKMDIGEAVGYTLTHLDQYLEDQQPP